MRAMLRLLSAGLLLAVAWPVFALGLGRLEVRSEQGQPLLAEIPIVSSDPAELRQLQARLASPETFARIGLEPPHGLVSDLQFSVALDPHGRPVIRVTSAAPVHQESLTFLLEVDWGQGRLVREYSALVAVPDTVAAPAQPAIEAPVVAPGSTIVRAPDRSVSDPSPAAAPSTAAAAAGETETGPAVAARPGVPTAATGELPPVEAGQTLSAIAAPLASEAGISVNQAMLLLLRANPDAFIRGNVNLVRQGAVLRVPPRNEWTEFSAAEANAVVREQVGQWREMRRPAPQPELATDAPSESAGAALAAAAGPAPQARLEITPPSGDARRAGSQSGIDAGGGGDMLRQDLQQANESLAARNAEVDELKARLADLEQLQQQQQQLIELKDAELAAAQQRMEASNRESDAGGGMSWLWLGAAVLVIAALAFVIARRRPATTPSGRRFDTSSRAGETAKPARPIASPTTDVATSGKPTWHAGAGAAGAVTEPAARVDSAPAPVEANVEPEPAPMESEPAPAPMERGPGLAGPSADPAPLTVVEDASAAPAELPAGLERLELARAYLDLGDTETARTLLHEVAAGEDATAAADAGRLLRSLD